MVSIIIPVYNGECYLEQCKRCLQKQTFKDLEVVFVDDGSKDDSLKKLYDIKEDLSQYLIQIFHQENKGNSAARNIGIELAVGEFITFMDQDDYLEDDYIEILYRNIEDNDIIVSGYNRTKLNGRILRKVCLNDGEWAKFLNISTWGKIYRKEFIEINEIRFLDVVKGEDVYFTLKAYSKTTRIKTIPYVGYHWIDHDKSVTNTIHTQISESTSILYMLDKIYPELSGSKNITDNLVEYYFIKAVIYDLLSTVKGNEKCKIDDLYNQLFCWLNVHFPQYAENVNISFFKPKGELFATRFVIKCFFILKRMNLLLFFLHWYSRV